MNEVNQRIIHKSNHFFVSGKVSSGHWLIVRYHMQLFFFLPQLLVYLFFLKMCKTNFGSDIAASL